MFINTLQDLESEGIVTRRKKIFEEERSTPYTQKTPGKISKKKEDLQRSNKKMMKMSTPTRSRKLLAQDRIPSPRMNMNSSKKMKKKISTYAPKLRSFQPGAGEEEISGGKILAMDVTGTSPRPLQLKFGKFGKFDRKDKMRDNLGLLEGILPAPKRSSGAGFS